MNDKKKLILATIAYVVLSMAIALPWHLFWFHDLYEKMGAFTREEPIVALGLLTMVIQGMVIAYLYPFWHRGGHPIIQGIKFTFIAGLLIYTTMGPAMAAKIKIEPIMTFLIYHSGFQSIQFVLTGAALGLIYGQKE